MLEKLQRKGLKLMAKYIVQHRRGTSAQWANYSTEIPREGEIVIEIDEVNSLHKLKIGDGIHTYAELAYLKAGDEIVTQVLAEAKPRVVTVELTADWNQDAEGKYSQVIALENITKHSRLDLQPSVDMLAEFKQLGLVFVTENNDGVITVYSVGNMPSTTYTMQATIVETECDGGDTIIGIPVGASAAQADWSQTDETKADYIKNKPTFGALASKDEVAKTDLATDIQASLDKADTAIQSIEGLATEQYVDNAISAIPTPDVSGQINTHNTSTSAHNDIRVLISDLTTKLNNFLDVDDTTSDQLSEVLTLIENNKGTLESLTTSKINVSDIIDNLTTASTSKVLSANQGVAIKALIDALQTEVDTHENNKSNPHGVTLAQLGVTATATELNYVDGVTSNVQTQLNSKMGDYSIELYNGTYGNPKPVKFATVNYSTCNSENGVAIKLGMVSGHGNGSSYAFLQDAIIKVGHTGNVTVDNFKYYGAETALDGARQFGDIFWTIDTTNKVVDFYCLMGQYARLQMTPYKRVTYSSGGTITQYTSCTVYSSGEKVWGNNSDIALMSDIKSAASNTTYTLTKSGTTITLTGSDGSTTSVTDADTNTTYSAATASAAGLMSASDKSKLDGIATGANKITVDSSLSSSSTNPVQNKVINSALAGKAPSTHTHTKSQITDFPTSMPASDVYSWAKASSKPSYSASEVGAVPTSRTVNGKALSSNISLTASDVGADASGAASGVQTNLNSHTGNKSNPHGVTAAQVGALSTSGGTINGNLIVTGVSSLMTLHSYNPLYINNGTDNSKSTSLYTTDNNEFAIVSTGNTVVSTQSPASSCLRNSKLVSTDTNPTVNGEICWTYK